MSAQAVRALTVLTPIAAGQQEPLRSYLRGLAGQPEGSPLRCMPTTHFARWVILRDLPPDAAQPEPDPLPTPYLLFTACHDGSTEDYLAELSTRLAFEAVQIWGRCTGCPDPTAGPPLAGYLARHQLRTGFFFAAREATVQQVRQALNVRDRLGRLAVQMQGADDAQARAAFLADFGGRP